MMKILIDTPDRKEGSITLSRPSYVLMSGDLGNLYYTIRDANGSILDAVFPNMTISKLLPAGTTVSAYAIAPMKSHCMLMVLPE